MSNSPKRVFCCCTELDFVDLLVKTEINLFTIQVFSFYLIIIYLANQRRAKIIKQNQQKKCFTEI